MCMATFLAVSSPRCTPPGGCRSTCWVWGSWTRCWWSGCRTGRPPRPLGCWASQPAGSCWTMKEFCLLLHLRVHFSFEKKSNNLCTLSRKISSFTSSSHCQAKHRLKNIYLTNSSHSQEKHLLKTTFNLRTYLACIIYNTFKKNILLQHLQHFSDPAASFRIRWAKFLATAASWPL